MNDVYWLRNEMRAASVSQKGRRRDLNNVILSVLVGMIVCIPVLFFGALISALWLLPQSAFVSGFLCGLIIALCAAALYVFMRQ